MNIVTPKGIEVFGGGAHLPCLPARNHLLRLAGSRAFAELRAVQAEISIGGKRWWQRMMLLIAHVSSAVSSILLTCRIKAASVACISSRASPWPDQARLRGVNQYP